MPPLSILLRIAHIRRKIRQPGCLIIEVLLIRNFAIGGPIKPVAKRIVDFLSPLAHLLNPAFDILHTLLVLHVLFTVPSIGTGIRVALIAARTFIHGRIQIPGLTIIADIDALSPSFLLDLPDCTLNLSDAFKRLLRRA